MRLNLLLMSMFAFVVGCTPSKEQQAESFAENEVKKILHDASSYESVETKIDSAFMSIYFDYDACKAAYDLVDLYNDQERLSEEYSLEKSGAAIWSDSYDSFGKERYAHYQSKLEKLLEKIKDNEEEINNKITIIKNRKDSIQEGEFCGWLIHHRFRCANSVGFKSLNDILLVADPDFENLIIRMILDEDDPQGYEKISEMIDKVLDSE